MSTTREKKECKSTDITNAAVKIQSFFRGYASRKQTNIYGRSQGKEIEIYLPLGVKKRDSKKFSYQDMIGGYKTTLCRSEFFNIQIDFMHFGSTMHKVSIAEIVTVPFRQIDEEKSNLRTEKEIDDAVGDFLCLLESFAKASSSKAEPSFFSLQEILTEYNKKHHRHPLRLTSWLAKYLEKPEHKHLFSGEMLPVKKHQNVEICFIYDSTFAPNFLRYAGPRTDFAASIVSQNEYKSGKLLAHVQKTFSMAVQDYKPDMLNRDFNHIPQQIKLLQEARSRAEKFVEVHPLPPTSDKEKILGLLTICVEHVITLTHAAEYKTLHEKADRPAFSLRHILHYVKKNICTAMEIQWFEEMFAKHLTDIQHLLCANKYIPDYRGNEGAYGHPTCFSKKERYDAIFDLFGDFSNKMKLSPEDKENSYLMFGAQEYGIESWEKLFDNHLSLSGRTHLRLQKTINTHGKREYHPLFEARRLQLMTVHEYVSGKSQIQPPSVAQARFCQLFSKKSEAIEVIDGGCKLHSGPIKLWSFK